MHYFVAEKMIGQAFILNDSTLRQLRQVLKLKSGTNIICIFENKHYLSIYQPHQSIKVKALKVIASKPTFRPKKITLFICLIRGLKFNYLLQKCTELGINEIIPIISERSVVKLNFSAINKKIKRWSMICQEAAEQSHQFFVPNIPTVLFNINAIKPYLGKDNWVFTTNDQIVRKNLTLPLKLPQNHLTYLIGPEGGLTENELKIIQEYKCEIFSLGNFCLRSETAAVYINSLIKASSTCA